MFVVLFVVAAAVMAVIVAAAVVAMVVLVVAAVAIVVAVVVVTAVANTIGPRAIEMAVATMSSVDVEGGTVAQVVLGHLDQVRAEEQRTDIIVRFAGEKMMSMDEWRLLARSSSLEAASPWSQRRATRPTQQTKREVAVARTTCKEEISVHYRRCSVPETIAFQT